MAQPMLRVVLLQCNKNRNPGRCLPTFTAKQAYTRHAQIGKSAHIKKDRHFALAQHKMVQQPCWGIAKPVNSAKK